MILPPAGRDAAGATVIDLFSPGLMVLRQVEPTPKAISAVATVPAE